jgi:K+-sensing histidine kinase KdpD
MQRDRQDLDESEAQIRPQTLQKQEVDADELLANVSDALRTPLTTVKGYAQTLLRQEQHMSQQERHEFLQTIDEASDELAAVINRLLKEAQVEADGLRIKYFL